MLTASSLYQTPNVLAPDYSMFEVDGAKLLLTGHSHQAWPDCAFEGQQEAFLDAAHFVDEKWERAFAKADRVRMGFAKLLGNPSGHIALGQNTHELVFRFLSALPFRDRTRLVTTTGEFHSIRRQLDRLALEGIEVVKVDAVPVDTLVERLMAKINDQTAAVLVSAVLFQNGAIAPYLPDLLKAAKRFGAQLLIDAYHAINVVPFSLPEQDLQEAYVVGGGYKYCQLGEGNCFLYFPADCDLKPIYTGWFSEFFALGDAHRPGEVVYGEGPHRFAGSTYDPTSHYRGARVFDFFEERGLDIAMLRAVSQHQVGLMLELFDRLDLNPERLAVDRSLSLQQRGGFLALHSAEAGEISRQLRARGVFTDFRGTILRLGPAPYLSDTQLQSAMAILGELFRTLD